MNKDRLCNFDYDNELNMKINKRYFPSIELQPNFDPRPLSTKYSIVSYPLMDKHNVNTSETLRKYSKFDSSKVFFPGNSKAPVDHFLDNIDTETSLKNHKQMLTKNDAVNYIPSKKSDMYKLSKYTDNTKGNLHKLPHQIRGADNRKCMLAPKTFFNHTKYNVKNL